MDALLECLIGLALNVPVRHNRRANMLSWGLFLAFLAVAIVADLLYS